MTTYDKLRRWWRDVRTQDENIKGTPERQIRDLERVFTSLTPDQQQREIDWRRKYANYYYLIHQGERTPQQIHQAFGRLTRAMQDQQLREDARRALHYYGGPPTRETLAESLERSQQEREREMGKYAAPTAQRETHTDAPVSTKETAAKVREHLAEAGL
jgi:hypothetical protein